MSPDVSIIIPVYNASPWLHRCLDSIVNQSLKNIEIICVNDASTDSSIDILREYQKKDSRVKVLNLECNRGEAGARNFALPLAQGRYIGFVDSDDYVEATFYETLYRNAVEQFADISKGGVQRFYNGVLDRPSNVSPSILNNKYHFSSAFWTAIYRADLLKMHNITFMNGLICGTDLVFLIQAVANANFVYAVDSPSYIYCKRDDSADSPILSISKIKSVLASAHFIVDFLNNFSVTSEEYAIAFAARFQIICSLTARAASEERDTVSLLLAENCIQLYAKCPYKKEFQEYYPFHAYSALQASDVAGLAKSLLPDAAPVSRTKGMAAALRARLTGSRN